ncbi:hypothetical protein M8818_002336 [Zalaria obscura]|uniref:Uncharacterized protein n=1 Tax=Zalaria obscura TaxID=2024903 RepID=A0ACC3SHJ3_9PEZI
MKPSRLKVKHNPDSKSGKLRASHRTHWPAPIHCAGSLRWWTEWRQKRSAMPVQKKARLRSGSDWPEIQARSGSFRTLFPLAKRTTLPYMGISHVWHLIVPPASPPGHRLLLRQWLERPGRHLVIKFKTTVKIAVPCFDYGRQTLRHPGLSCDALSFPIVGDSVGSMISPPLPCSVSCLSEVLADRPVLPVNRSVTSSHLEWMQTRSLQPSSAFETATPTDLAHMIPRNSVITWARQGLCGAEGLGRFSAICQALSQATNAPILHFESP